MSSALILRTASSMGASPARLSFAAVPLRPLCRDYSKLFVAAVPGGFHNSAKEESADYRPRDRPMLDAAAEPSLDARAAVEAIPRSYNFAADIIERNLKAGRAEKPAFIDPRGTWSYGQLAERVDRFGNALRSLGLRREER